jgi:hypothetical protein
MFQYDKEWYEMLKYNHHDIHEFTIKVSDIFTKSRGEIVYEFITEPYGQYWKFIQQTKKDYMAYKKRTRRNSLKKALNAVGLYIRHDSKLCHGWISSTLEPGWTQARVVKKCIEEKWLHEYTRFYNIVQNEISDLEDSLGTNITRQMYEEIRSRVKNDILETRSVPEKLPWLSSEST